MGDSKRIKGQDHPSGSSEYYLMVPGGIQTLKDALVDINVNGELLIAGLLPTTQLTAALRLNRPERPRALLLASMLLTPWWQQHDSVLPMLAPALNTLAFSCYVGHVLTLIGTLSRSAPEGSNNKCSAACNLLCTHSVQRFHRGAQ